MWAAERQLPVWLSLSALTFLAIVTVIRLAWVRSTLPDRMMNATLTLGLASMLLHEPAIANLIAPIVPGGLSTVYDGWHWLYGLGCTVGAGIWTLGKWGPERYLRPFLSMIAAAFLLGIIFLVLSTPARHQHLGSIAEVGGWREVAYFVAYSSLLVALCIWLIPPILQMRRDATEWRAHVVATVVLVVVLILGMVNAVVIGGGAFVDAYGTPGPLADMGRSSTSGSTLLPITAAATVSLLPSVIRAASQILRLDDQSRQVREITPVWRAMTSVVPHVRLHEQLRWPDRLGITPHERWLRRKIEIIDAAIIFNAHADALPAAVDELIERTIEGDDDQEDMRTVAELVMAARTIARYGMPDDDVPPQPWAPPVPPWQMLVRLWEPASALVEEALEPSGARQPSRQEMLGPSRTAPAADTQAPAAADVVQQREFDRT